jgi:hypothetical protein
MMRVSELSVPPRSANRSYLETKRTRFGHLLSLITEAPDGNAAKREGERSQ